MPVLCAAKNIEFTIICNRNKVPAVDLPANVSVIEIAGKLVSYYFGFADYLFSRALLKKYPSNSSFWRQFDIIHINQVMGPALQKLQKTGVPNLFLVHHPVTADNEIAIQESKGINKIYWWLKYFFLVRWQRQMCQLSKYIVTVSETMKERIASDYNCPKVHISILPNGVNGDLFFPMKDMECKYDVVAVGSFVHPRKGFRYLLQAYKQLAARGYSIADVGRRTEKQKFLLNKITGVQCLGTIPQEDLITSIRSSRVLISTSLFEGFGLSIIEAFSSGHPAVPFSVGAVPEVLQGIDTSLLIPQKNIAAMVKKVDQILRLPPSAREQKGKEYRKAVLEKYPIEKSASALLSLYQKISQNHG